MVIVDGLNGLVGIGAHEGLTGSARALGVDFGRDREIIIGIGPGKTIQFSLYVPKKETKTSSAQGFRDEELCNKLIQ